MTASQQTWMAVRRHLVRGTCCAVLATAAVGLAACGSSCDHRMIYGADAAAFLSDLQALLGRPLTLAV